METKMCLHEPLPACSATDKCRLAIPICLYSGKDGVQKGESVVRSFTTRIRIFGSYEKQKFGCHKSQQSKQDDNDKTTSEGVS